MKKQIIAIVGLFLMLTSVTFALEDSSSSAVTTSGIVAQMDEQILPELTVTSWSSDNVVMGVSLIFTPDPVETARVKGHDAYFNSIVNNRPTLYDMPKRHFVRQQDESVTEDALMQEAVDNPQQRVICYRTVEHTDSYGNTHPKCIRSEPSCSQLTPSQVNSLKFWIKQAKKTGSVSLGSVCESYQD